MFLIQTLKNVMSGWISTIMASLLKLIIIPIVVNTVGKEIYGMWLLVFNVINYFYMADAGVSNAISRLYAFYKAKNDENRLSSLILVSYGFLLVVAIISCIVLFFSENFVFDFIKGIPGSQNIFHFIFIVGIVEFFLTFTLKANAGVIRGEHRYDTTFNLDTAGRLLTILFVLAFYHFNRLNIYTITLIVSGGRVLPNIALFFYIRRRIFIDAARTVMCRTFERNVVRELFDLGFSSVVISAGSIAQNALPVLIFSNIFGAANVALYAIPYGIMVMCSQFINTIFVGVLPKTAELCAKEDMASIRRISLYGMTFSLVINSIIFTSFLSFGDIFLKLWLGRKVFTGADFSIMYTTLMLVLGGLILTNMQKVNNVILRSSGHHWWVSMETIITTSSLLAAGIILSWNKNMLGFAIANVLAGVVKYAIYMYFLQKFIFSRSQTWDMVKGHLKYFLLLSPLIVSQILFFQKLSLNVTNVFLLLAVLGLVLALNYYHLSRHEPEIIDICRNAFYRKFLRKKA